VSLRQAALSMLRPMPISGRAIDRGTIGGEGALAELAKEFREARLAAGLSQQHVADAARISRSVCSKIERAKARYLSIVTASRICAVLGLQMWIRAYPGGRPLRDAAHGERLQCVLDKVRAPLRYRTEVPLPQRADGPTELRAWDAELRDDAEDHFLLVVAATRSNRRVLREHPQLCGLTRLRTATVLRLLGRVGIRRAASS
jgi:transcriptional regulator with XRE-family HTH domain